MHLDIQFKEDVLGLLITYIFHCRKYRIMRKFLVADNYECM